MMISRCHKSTVTVETGEDGAHYVCYTCGMPCETILNVEPDDIIDMDDLTDICHE